MANRIAIGHSYTVTAGQDPGRGRRAAGRKAVEALSQFGGTVLKISLSKESEQELQHALHGVPAAV